MPTLPRTAPRDLHPEELLRIRGGSPFPLLPQKPIICYWPLQSAGATRLSSTRQAAGSGAWRL